MKKIKIDFLITLALFALPMNVVWGQSFPTFSGGDGSNTAPYQITTAAQLADLAAFVNAKADASATCDGIYFKLMNDLDLSTDYGTTYDSGAGWIPIGGDRAATNANGSGNDVFKGVFDGNNKTISGLYINRTNTKQGLFGEIKGNAIIKDLNVTGNLDVTGISTTPVALVGGIVGVASGAALIDNCSFSGTVKCTVTNTTNSGGGIGCIAGAFGWGGTNTGEISNCRAEGTVTLSRDGANQDCRIGGIVGHVESASRVMIEKCYFNGTVTSTQNRAGGIVGSLQASTIRNCYASGSVEGALGAGGIVGFAANAVCSIENCYATNTVTANAATGNITAGGIAGEIGGTVANFTVKNCIALNPSVTGTNDNSKASRVWGCSNSALNFSQNVNNYAWDGLPANAANAANTPDYNGDDVTAAAARSGEDFWKTVATFDPSIWNMTAGKLPGLTGSPVEEVDLPAWLQAGSFTIDASGEHTFTNLLSGYTAEDVASQATLTVTVTCESVAPVTIADITLSGDNQDDFVITSSIATIAGNDSETFTVAPKTGLGVGIYKATVTVTDESNNEMTFDVVFGVTDGQNSGIPSTIWYDGGAGPFNISYPDELAGLAQLVNSGIDFDGITVNLLNDIDLSVSYGDTYDSGAGWIPVGGDRAAVNAAGTGTDVFKGVFDGNNKTISGLYINRTSFKQGLFGEIKGNAVIKNLNVKGSITVTKDVSGAQPHILVGGIAGIASGAALIDSCSFSGEITATIDHTGNNICGVGGIVGSFGLGDVANSSGKISRCWSDAAVTANRASVLQCGTGGIAGSIEGNATVEKCYFTGSVESNSNRAAGIVGSLNQGKVRNCYASGSVKGNSSLGGIVGLGSNAGTTVEYCYAINTVEGATNNVGGIFGEPGNNGANFTVTHSIALNKDITQTSGTGIGRIYGANQGTSFTNNANNYGWDGVQQNGASSIWTDTSGDPATNYNGTDATVTQINDVDFIKTIVFKDDDDISAWTFAAGKLPGLNGEPVDMPEYLIDIPNSLPALNLSNEKAVATEYYDLLGIKIAHPIQGAVYFVKTTFESGKTNVVKQFIAR